MVRNLFKRAAALGLVVVGAEAVFALLKPSPELESFDPSGEFGDPGAPTLRVAVLGDSSVTAPGVTGPEEIWVSLICSRLAETRHIVLESFAVGGSMAHDLITEQMDDAISFEPDLIFVSVGANDALRGVPVRLFEKNLDILIGRLAGTGATIVQSGVGVIGTIPRLYPPLSTLLSARSARFDQAHRRVATTHGTWVIDQRNDDPTLWNRDRSLWAADHFHVSAAGHARWAETTWHTLDPLMNGARGSA
ncbi:MAG TPA: GDSL-type esterase/lipase family protein [Acidimicrobiia bacterium]